MKPSFEIIEGDCLEKMQALNPSSVNVAIFSPPYPGIRREYGYWRPDEWLAWMRRVMAALRRVVKESGSAVVVIQPNNERIGQRQTWAWRFALDAAEASGIVQDA